MRLLLGDCCETLKTLPEKSVQCCVTSPPYFGLRSYGEAGAEIGKEKTPAEFVASLVAVFREVRRVLKDDGTVWLNLGDTYAATGGKERPHRDSSGGIGNKGTRGEQGYHAAGGGFIRPNTAQNGIKPKDLIGIPWRVAFALQDDGWILRQDIIWCISGGAWVYARTQKGDMPVMVKDLVRLDPTTVKLWNGEKWTQVLGWGPSNDTRSKLELVLRSGERIGCTGGHLWPTQRGNVKAEDLQAGDIIRTCSLPEPDAAETPPYLTDDALWFLGLYLAEGSRNGAALQIAGHSREIDRLERVRKMANHYGGSATVTLDGNKQNIRVYGRVIHAMVDQFVSGKNAENKSLKACVWELPNHALRSIVEGYLHGDGHDDPNNPRIRLGFCRNYALERDLRTLAARLKATLTLKPTVSKNQHGEFPAFRGEWRWTRSGHRNEQERGEIMEIRASRARQFWDIAVEDEPHLFALASGVLTHNCKPNPMPESVRDRCTKAHEYVFLLAKKPKYYFDSSAMQEPAVRGYGGSTFHKGKTAEHQLGRSSKAEREERETRNRRSVWTVTTKPYKGAHFATFPPDLIEPCILAGSRPGDMILDPFGGSGTTAQVALKHGRQVTLCELYPEYAPLIYGRVGVPDFI